MRRALITGITGQDGSYLAERLLQMGYEVHGLVRRVALEDPEHRLRRIQSLLNTITLHAASLESFPSLFAAISDIEPHEIYHLAAQSYVGYSFEDSFSTFQTNINGTHYLLESARRCCPNARIYFAGSSEMFGKVDETPQTEDTRFHPRSPYGISKVTGYDLARNYREAYSMFVATGILFNHESPRRGFEFVTRKITTGVARIKAGLETELPLGNLDARRDWGFAGDYVEAMRLMLTHDHPDDFVIATGETHSVRDFCERAFERAGLNWENHVVVRPEFHRPAEVQLLQGNASKAKRVLGWQATVGFEGLVDMMVDHDLAMLNVRPC